MFPEVTYFHFFNSFSGFLKHNFPPSLIISIYTSQIKLCIVIVNSLSGTNFRVLSFLFLEAEIRAEQLDFDEW